LLVESDVAVMVEFGSCGLFWNSVESGVGNTKPDRVGEDYIERGRKCCEGTQQAAVGAQGEKFVTTV
jgi:hypothetical protein